RRVGRRRGRGVFADDSTGDEGGYPKTRCSLLSESGFKSTDQPHSPSAEHRRLTVAGRRVRLRTRESRNSDWREYAARRRTRASENSAATRGATPSDLTRAERPSRANSGVAGEILLEI